MFDNLSLLDCIESMNEGFYDRFDPTDSFRSNIPYTDDASRQNYELLDISNNFDEAEFEQLLNNSLAQIDTDCASRKRKHDHFDTTDPFQSNILYTDDASRNRQNKSLLDLSNDFDETEFEQLLNNSSAQIDTDCAPRKRKHSSELSDSKRQRLDTSEKGFEKLMRDSLAQIDPVKLFEPPNSSLTNGKSVQMNQSHSSEMRKSGDSSFNSELSADKSNSSSFGRGHGSLKIVGKPLREKPRDAKKSKKSSTNNETSSESPPPPPPQEKEQQKIEQKPSKITLSWKVIGPKQELANNSTNIGQNFSDAMAREYRPKPVQIKILPTETLKPKQPNQMIEPQKLPSLTTASHQIKTPMEHQRLHFSPHPQAQQQQFQNVLLPNLQAQHFENPKPIQRTYQNLTAQNINNLNYPRQPEEAKFNSLPFSLMNACRKKLRLVTKETANVSKARGEKSQPVVQRKNAEFHFVTLKKHPDDKMSSEPQKIFKLVPFRSAKANIE